MNTAVNHDLKIKKRIQLVHIAASELGLIDPKWHETDPEDDYHTILRRWNRQGTRQPVTSSLQMSYQQLGELLDFFKGLGFRLRRKTDRDEARGTPPHPSPLPRGERELGGETTAWKKYESSIKGLKDEICDLARDRFGESWELPLNNFCRRFGVERWQWLDVSHGRAVKAALLRLNASPPSRIHASADSSEVPF